MDLRVECEPSPTGDPDPAVVWFGSRRVPVLAVVDRWWGAHQRWWRIETEDGLYVLRRDERTGEWDLAAVTAR